MRAAVTGGTGFIGRNLVEGLLREGYALRILTRNQQNICPYSGDVEWYTGDLSDRNRDWSEFFDGVDVCYNCAGVLNGEDSIWKTNVEGTEILLDAAAGKIRHWIQLSSAGVYKKQSDGVITEKSVISPEGEYETSKAESESLVINRSGENGFTYTIVRPSNVYGRDMTNTSLFKMIEVIDKGFFFFIKDIESESNYIHVENVVNGLLLCGSHEKAVNQIFNISDHTRLRSIVNTIAQTLGKKEPTLVIPEALIKFLTVPGLFFDRWPLTLSRVEAMTGREIFSNDKIETMLDYRHTYSIIKGFTELTEHWRTIICQREK